MRTIKIFMICSVMLTSMVLLQSCDKDLEQKLPEHTDLANYSQVQVYNAIQGSNRSYIAVDGVPVTGAAVAVGTSFPLTAYSIALPAGLRSFVLYDTLKTTTQVPLTFAENFQASTSYTVFAYDTSTSPKQVTVPTVIEVPLDTTARVRFASFIYSVNASAPVDVYSVKRKTNIFTNVTNTQVTPFIPYASALSDTLIVRPTGALTTLAQLSGFSPTQKRSYTLVYRGGATKTLSAFVNR